MISHSAPRLAALLIAVSLVSTAHAEGAVAAPTTAAARDSIAQAIQEQKSRRTGSIVGMAIGGAIAITGAVVSSVASAQNEEDRRQGISSDRNTTTGTLVGAAIGLPVFGISLYHFLNSQHEINRLHHESVMLGYAEQDGHPMLRLALKF